MSLRMLDVWKERRRHKKDAQDSVRFTKEKFHYYCCFLGFSTLLRFHPSLLLSLMTNKSVCVKWLW